jgi:hypothetical protein
MPQRVTRVPEVYEHETAFCHTPPHRSSFGVAWKTDSPRPHDSLLIGALSQRHHSQVIATGMPLRQ